MLELIRGPLVYAIGPAGVAAEDDHGLVLTVRQPWATLVVNGFKRVESRDWQTSHRGPLWIFAAEDPPDDDDMNLIEPMYRTLYGAVMPPLPTHYPLGVLVGRVDLADIISVDEFRTEAEVLGLMPEVVEAEAVFVMRNPEKLVVPIRVATPLMRHRGPFENTDVGAMWEAGSADHALWRLPKSTPEGFSRALRPAEWLLDRNGLPPKIPRRLAAGGTRIDIKQLNKEIDSGGASNWAPHSEAKRLHFNPLDGAPAVQAEHFVSPIAQRAIWNEIRELGLRREGMSIPRKYRDRQMPSGAGFFYGGGCLTSNGWWRHGIMNDPSVPGPVCTAMYVEALRLGFGLPPTEPISLMAVYHLPEAALISLPTFTARSAPVVMIFLGARVDVRLLAPDADATRPDTVGCLRRFMSGDIVCCETAVDVLFERVVSVAPPPPVSPARGSLLVVMWR
eukprot:Polyplicarium_translucidae@DN2210_c0_g1_i1.p1